MQHRHVGRGVTRKHSCKVRGSHAWFPLGPLIDTLPSRIAHKDKPQSSCLSLVYTMNNSPIAVRYRPDNHNSTEYRSRESTLGSRERRNFIARAPPVLRTFYLLLVCLLRLYHPLVVAQNSTTSYRNETAPLSKDACQHQGYKLIARKNRCICTRQIGRHNHLIHTRD